MSQAKNYRLYQENNPEYTNAPQEWYYRTIINGAKKRNIDFNITIEEFTNCYTGNCSLSGFPLKTVKYYAQRVNQTASLDRIDSSLGYNKENVQWIHKKINTMKMDIPNQEFIYICKKISNNNSIVGL